MSTPDHVGSSSSGARILVFPYPTPGHIIALIDLTRLLLTRGLTVTVLVTPNHLPLLQPLLSSTHASTSIHPLVLSPPETPPNTNTSSLPGIVSSVCRYGALYTPILHWFNSHPSPPVAILSDIFLGWTHHLATNLGLPRLVFWPSGALTASLSNHMWRDLPKVGDPANQNSTVSFPGIPNFPTFPWWQISNTFRDFKEGDKDYEFFRDGMVANTRSWGLVFNSFTELERLYIDHLKCDLGHNRVWAVGPLLPPLDDVTGPANRGGSSSAPTDKLMAWLDSKPGDSVVYICFGSRVVLTSKQVEVLAAAIECSGVHFIWCVKKSGRGDAEGDAGFIPDGFEDRVGGRGFVIRGWAPQVTILRHRAVSVFVTHCGWNSVLEGLAAGVLMLTWPRGADQFTNAKLLVDQLGVGFRVCEGGEQNIPNLDELTGLLAESVGVNRAKREGVVRLHEEAWNAVNGGSSARDLDKLVKELNLLGASTFDS
ncbi:UDP-glycosyltransferase 89B2-like [Rhododendron vialii]|uniref:UDP-glycosyltransferase 89B2-like n=1 Tax=Rhododendron vialii TaxID=182163 RepID=UPI00265F321F|nr:UDP-glycosyltransferase 89B2-like [Rhododendron vialii]